MLLGGNKLFYFNFFKLHFILIRDKKVIIMNIQSIVAIPVYIWNTNIYVIHCMVNQIMEDHYQFGSD